jgi:hypothetical protein
MYVRSIEDIPDREIIGGEIQKKHTSINKMFLYRCDRDLLQKKEEGDIVAVLYQRRA